MKGINIPTVSSMTRTTAHPKAIVSLLIPPAFASWGILKRNENKPAPAMEKINVNGIHHNRCHKECFPL